ncbi:MAG: hypothetical protein WBA98_03680 [Gordonia sp. (in: high G+C Gram-positive bacteria)]|uniref:hypothetical protein n=1 Tax=Gordonia sp. (in: high G+C Gram-positive bacteria) TaxID=84139 RepID=UPI003C7583DA
MTIALTAGDMPAGTPWWVAVILIIAFGRPALGSAFMARVPGWLGEYARRRRESTPEARADQTLSAAWERQDREIKRLAKAYDSLDDDYRALSDRVDDLDRKLAEATKRFFVALGYVRQLMTVIRRLDPQHEIPAPPESLEVYL